MKRRLGTEGEEPMLGDKPSVQLDRDPILVRIVKEYAGKANWCFEKTICRLCFCLSMRAALIIFGCFALVFFVASLDPWGTSDHWNADDQYKYSGVKDTEYPQMLAYVPAKTITSPKEGEYSAPISPEVEGITYMGKPHYVDNINSAKAGLERYTKLRDSACGSIGAEGNTWESHRPDKSEHVKDFCVKQRNTPSSVTDLPYDWCDDTANWKLHFCRVPDKNKMTDAWTIVRVGPFETTGGYDWNSIAWKGELADVGEEMLKIGADALYIDAAFASTMNLDGEYMGFPPIHAHHFHMTPNFDLVGPAEIEQQVKTTPLPHFYNGWQLVHEFHGDTSCKEAQGGIGCQYEGFPPSHAIKLGIDEFHLGDDASRGFLSCNSEFNDVRAPGSSPIEWFLEVAVHHYVASGPDRPAPKYVISRDTVAPSFLPYPVPYYTPSVTWNSHVFDYVRPDNEIVSIYAHCHHTILDAQWLFQASAEDLGLTLEHGYGLRMHMYWQDFVPAAKGVSVSQVKSHVLASLKKSQKAWNAANPTLANATEAVKAKNGYPRALCKTNSTSADFIENEMTKDSVQGYMHDRQIAVKCAADFTSITPNMRVTAVHFTRAGWSPHVSGIIRRILATRKYEYYSGQMQHDFWRFVYKEPNEEETKSKMVFYILARPEDEVSTPSVDTRLVPVPRGFAAPSPSFLIPAGFDMMKLHFFDWFA